MRMSEKSAILEIINLTDQVNFFEIGKVDEVLRLANRKEVIKQTQFGGRLLKRLEKMSRGEHEDCSCVLCGKIAENQVVCDVCYANLRESAEEYRQGKRKETVNEDKENVDIINGAIFENKKLERERQSEVVKLTELADLRKDIADSDRYTEDLIRNLDASMDRLASKKAVKSSNRMLMAILVISLINTISIIAIATIVFRYLQLM